MNRHSARTAEERLTSKGFQNYYVFSWFYAIFKKTAICNLMYNVFKVLQKDNQIKNSKLSLYYQIITIVSSIASYNNC